MIKNIFARIWAFWGMVTFIATFLVIFLPSMVAYLMVDPKGQRYFIFISRLWMRSWLFLICCPLKVNGRENFRDGEAYVVIFNHNALLDVPLSAPFVPGPTKTIAKASFSKIPLFGWFYAKGSVLVDRKNERSRFKSFEAMKKVLLTGMHMCIYPEGTRNRTNEPIKKFYDGAFKLSKTTNKEIIPCVIIGTKKAMPIHKSFYLLPTKLQMHFLPAINPGDKTFEEMKNYAHQLMSDFYVKHV